MDKLIAIFVFLAILILPNLGQAVSVHSHELDPNFKLIGTKFCEINTIDVEKKIGRTLTLKEKLVLKLVKAKSNKLTHQTTDQPKKTDVFSIVGFSSSLLGLLILIFSSSLSLFLGAIFGILAIHLSLVGLIRINRKPESRKGKALAIVGLLLGGAVAIGAVIIGFGRII